MELIVNGEVLHYEHQGEGPVVLFIHSLGTHAGLWHHQFAVLGARYSCLAFDCRGHGRSTRNGPFSVEAVAADLDEALEKLGIDRLHCVALSMGGPIALALNARRPRRFRSLVLAATYVDTSAERSARAAATAAAIASLGMASFGRQYASDRLTKAASADDFELVAKAIGRMEPAAYLEAVGAIMARGFAEEVKTVDVPTLVLWGDRDAPGLRDQAQQLADGIVGSHFEQIAGVGHLMNLDDPDRFSRIILAFIGKASRRPRHRLESKPPQ